MHFVKICVNIPQRIVEIIDKLKKKPSEWQINKTVS